jgi:hypothetical protein
MESINLICSKCKHNRILFGGCDAFDEIPDEILSGKNKHEKPLTNQKNNITFELIDKKNETTITK